MSTAAIVKAPSASPGDTSGLDALGRDGVEPADVRAVVAKTEGNGCVNDFSRELAARQWAAALPGAPVTIMSGGTEGVLSPHVTLLAETAGPIDGGAAGSLALGAVETDPIATAELGRRPQSEAVAEAVRAACREAAIDLDQLALALVKCPLLGSDRIGAGSGAGPALVTDDPYESMARSRGASALGVALASGEADARQVERGLAGDLDVWSSLASTSAGREVNRCHVVVLGASAAARGPLHAKTVVMRDALDAVPALTALEEIRSAGGEIVQVFAKAEADPTGSIRGHRHTMLTDSDLHSTRHARAAVGGLLAALCEDPAIYVSGGAEHQGPPGGGPIAIVWRRPE